VTIWSGLDGNCAQLAQLSLPLLAPNNLVFTSPVSMSFSGTAQSVAFSGGNDQLAFDNISFQPQAVPEPTSWLLLALGSGGGAFFLRGARHLKAGPEIR
jgi:hypothetical protein